MTEESPADEGSAAEGPAGESLPYGPNTPAVRAFLRRAAERSAAEWVTAALVYERMQHTLPFRGADHALGQAIERASRESARDAVVAPIVQIARAKAPGGADAPPETVERFAEAALAAALALIARDLLPAETVAILYRPFERMAGIGDR